MIKKITLIFLIIINIFNLNINENIINKEYIEKPIIKKNKILSNKTKTITNKNTSNINNKIKTKELKNPIKNIASISINNKTYLLYEQSSNQNTVEKNVEILIDSVLPPIKNTNIYLAAHSGTGKKAYFNELFNLQENDLIYLYHNDNKYTYQIYSIQTQLKDGNIEIKKDNNTNLILTTCSKEENKQLVIISKLKES